VYIQGVINLSLAATGGIVKQVVNGGATIRVHHAIGVLFIGLLSACSDDAAPASDAPECESARCLVALATMQGGISDLVLDDSNVYWATHEGNVVKIARDGGTPTTIASEQGNVLSIAVDATRVYWSTADGAINAVPIGGGDISTLANAQGNPWGLAVDASNVYWVNYNAGADGTVVKVPISGGSTTVLAAGQYYPVDMAIDADNLYVANRGLSKDGLIVKVPLAGDSPTALAGEQGSLEGIAPQAIVADGNSVYWTNGEIGTVSRITKTGGVPGTMASNQYFPDGIAVDDSHIYWVDEFGTVLKLPIYGGNPITLAEEPNTPLDIAVDATSLYWTDNGAIMKLTPK
jgi:sugar lactone lactonase YvrE